MKACHLLAVCLATSIISPELPASEKTPRKFYAYCIEMGVPKVKARPLAEQAKLLRELGYDGIGLPLLPDNELEANLKLLDDAGLQAFMFWASVNVNPAKPTAPDPKLLAAIRKLKGRPATVSVLLGGLKPGDPQGMQPAVKVLRDLGDAAAEAGVRISIYNHVNNWTESVPFVVEVVRKASHPHVGFNFNLCHWLKVDGEMDYRPLLRENAAKLFCVTINGAQRDAKTWTHGLIQPLDKGDFDNRALLTALNEIGYHGPVGLMCYGVPDEPRDHLTRSMKVLRSWQSKAADTEPLSLKPDPAAMQRWQAMRFGMFIHWGPVSLKGTEIGWSRGKEVSVEEYDGLYRQFNPVKFNADEWARIAKDAGMRYVVFTTKHHDGFCMWATEFTDYNIMRSPFGRDVVKELADACRKHGLLFCAYHSICDWWHPDYPLGSPGGKSQKPSPDMDRYNQYLKNQLAELLQNYGPLGILWFDGEWEKPWTVERGADLYTFLRKLQPSLIINNRVSKARAGMAGTSEPGQFAGDYDTPEQRVGKYQDTRPWETCMTICHQWAWKPEDKMKTLAECLHVLIRTAGGDGNLLFNIGPMPTGEIEGRQVERLKEMGAWLAKYGGTIYATRGGPFKPAKHVVSTRKGHTVYLHILAWPEETLKLPALPAKIVKSSVLTGGEATVKQTVDGIEIAVPKSDRQAIDTIVTLELDRPAIEINAIDASLTGESLMTGKKAKASNVYRNDNRHGAAKAIDDDEHTRWATDASTGASWLEVDLGKPQTFDRAVIQECVDYGARVKAFDLQYKDGDDWKTFHSGKAIGKDLEVKFAPVTARIVRLNITDAQGGPTIWEFHLYMTKAKQ
jgi:alpha-L-fucosidase